MKLSAKNTGDKSRRARKGGAKLWRRMAGLLLCLLILSSTMAGAFASEPPAEETPPDVTQPDVTQYTPDTPPEIPPETPDTPPTTPDTPPATPDTPPTTPENPPAAANAEPGTDEEKPEPVTPETLPENDIVMHTVTFFFNGGTDAAGNDRAVLQIPDNMSFTENNQPLPSPTKESSTLQGWCVLSELNEQTDVPFMAETPVNTDLNVLALWAENVISNDGEDNGTANDGKDNKNADNELADENGADNDLADENPVDDEPADEPAILSSICFIKAGTEGNETPETAFTYTPNETDVDVETAVKSAATALIDKGYAVANKTDDGYVQADDYDSYHYIDADSGELKPIRDLPADADTVSLLALPIQYTITYAAAGDFSDDVNTTLQAALTDITAPQNTLPRDALITGKNPTVYTVENGFTLLPPASITVNNRVYDFTGWTDGTPDATPRRGYLVTRGTTGNLNLTAHWQLLDEGGSLTITNTVTGENADMSKEFHFTIRLTESGVSGNFGTLNFTNGTATVTLKGGESATAVGLPAGKIYAVTEEEADKDNYSTAIKVNGAEARTATGRITANATESVEFINHMRDPAKVTITAQKTLSGRDPGRYVFLFELRDADGNLLQRVQNTGAQINFAELSFAEPGTYSYTITEYNDGRSGIRYDSHVYTVNINVVQATDANRLTATLEYRRDGQYYSNDGSRAPAFSNTLVRSYSGTGSGSGFVRTGDEANIALWVAAMVLAAATLVVIVVVACRKKKEKDDNSKK